MVASDSLALRLCVEATEPFAGDPRHQPFTLMGLL